MSVNENSVNIIYRNLLIGGRILQCKCRAIRPTAQKLFVALQKTHRDERNVFDHAIVLYYEFAYDEAIT